MIRNDIQVCLGERRIAFAMEIDPADPRDADLASYMRRNAVPEPELVHLMMRTVHEGNVVLDAGANIGYFTLLLSRLVGASGRVIAVEPSARNLEKLCRNIGINEISNVEVVPKALWSNPGRMLDWHLSETGGYDSLIANKYTVGKTTVEIVTLHDILLGKNIRFAKMDVEGAELEILRWKVPVIPFFVIEAAEENIEALCSKMRRAGNDVYAMHADGSFPSLLPSRCRLKPKALNSNLLFSTEYQVTQAWPEVLY